MRALVEDLEALAARAGVRSTPSDVLARARTQNRRRSGRRRLIASATVAVACVAVGAGLATRDSGDDNQLLVTQTTELHSPVDSPSTTAEAPPLATTADYLRAEELPPLFYFGSHTDNGLTSDSSGKQVSVPLTGCGTCPFIMFEGGVFTYGYGATEGKLRRIDLRTLNETAIVDTGVVYGLFPSSDGRSIWIVTAGQARRMDLTTFAVEPPVMLPADRSVRNVTGRYFVLQPRVRGAPFELWDHTTGATRIVAADATAYLDSVVTPDGDTLVAWYSSACSAVIGCELRIINIDKDVTTTVPLPQSRYGILGAAFSPSARDLAVLSSMTVAIVNNVAISPDGELVMVDVASGSAKAIEKASGGIQGPPSLQWSPDGNWLVFAGSTTRFHRLGTPDAASLPLDGYRYAFRPEH